MIVAVYTEQGLSQSIDRHATGPCFENMIPDIREAKHSYRVNKA
jgi:hypothetical protein